ncbi:uncharacterized protein LOC133532020 [Cydia pomonella]|uniref:uncharacterized protein LOC133532020 n=1 Tax=Cydia pomonella TaxID=82600 RepID=UPI002ADDEBB7|nr:uncharacterized protein LOC133532020 [Cydia pomonella]
MATTDAPLSSIVKVPAGGTAVLTCNSNDFNHNFMFWLFDTDKVVGPNNYYDERKYKYEVLSGKLHIDNVTPAESGIYRCVSRKLDGSGIAVGQVELVVSETFTTIAPVTLVAILVSIFVLISCAVLYWRLRKSWSKP